MKTWMATVAFLTGCGSVLPVPSDASLPVDSGFAADGAACALLIQTTAAYIPLNPDGAPEIAEWIIHNPSFDLSSSAPCSSQQVMMSTACQDFWNGLYQDANACVTLTTQGLQGQSTCCTVPLIQSLYTRLCRSPMYTNTVPGFSTLPNNPCAGPEPTR